jgi:excisionase family DNA binding protein
MVEFLTTRQLQEILHVDRTTIYRMADGGRVPAVKVGNQWRFPRHQIESWLKTQSPASVADDAGTAADPTAGLSGGQPGGLAVAGGAPALTTANIAKLLPAECVLKIQDAFADLLSVTLVVTDMRGVPLLPYSNLCGFLQLAHQSPGGRHWCQAEWATLAANLSVTPELTRGPCGMLHTRGVVRVGSEIKAQVVAAGIAPDQWPPEGEIARFAELLDVSEGAVRSKVTEVHYLDAAARQHLLVHVQRVADIIAHIISERNLLFARLQHIADLSQI